MVHASGIVSGHALHSAMESVLGHVWVVKTPAQHALINAQARALYHVVHHVLKIVVLVVLFLVLERARADNLEINNWG